MYQSNTSDYNEQDFNNLVTIFKNTILRDLKLSVDNTKWNMQTKYQINHACIHNKVVNVNKTCRIYQKNNELAIVSIKDLVTLPENIYRLEDLTKL